MGVTTLAGNRVWTLGRLALIALAVGFGTLAYRDHFFPEQIPWWQWVGRLTVGCALLIIALHDDAAPPERRARRVLRWGAAGVAGLAGAAFVVLQPQRGQELAAGIAAFIALVAFGLARWVPFGADDVRALVGDLGRGDDARESMGRPLARLSLAGMAIGLGVAAAYVNGTQHLAAFVLWLASLVVFAAAFWQRSAPPVGAEPWQRDGGPELSPRTAAVALLLILTLALALRAIALRDVPALLDPDEGRQGRWAERIWQDGFPDAFGLGWNVFPNLSYMTEYAWVQLRGTSNANLRLSAATVGVLSLVPVFFWARRWWGNVIALLAVLLLAINREHIGWSRLALNNIQQVLVAALMLAAFARVLRTRRLLDWVWLGYAIGLAFHTYHAAKLFPALLALTALLFAIGIRGFVRPYLAGALIGVVAFLLCFGPLLVTIYQYWSYFYGGTSNRVDLYQLVDAYRHGDIPQVRGYLTTHVLGCLLSFTSVPGESPTFDAFMAVPFLLGMGWMLWRWHEPRHAVVLVWTLGILVVGGMITDSPPWKARLLGFLPAVCLIPAVVAGRVRALLHRWSPRYADVVAVPLLLVWLASSAYANWYNIFIYSPVLQRRDTMTEMCHIIEAARLPATFYMAGGAVMAEPKVGVHDCMIAASPQRWLVDLAEDPLIVPVPPTNQGDAVLFVGPPQQELVPLIRHYYPEAEYDHREFQGAPVLHVFTLRAEVLERSRGLRALYRAPSHTWAAPEGVHTFQPPPDAQAADFPLRIIWRGQLWANTPGAYAFMVTGATARIDGAAVPGQAPITLPAGWHTIEMSAQFETPGDRTTLQWRPPGADDWAPIPRAALNTHPDSHGLLGRYFAGAIAASTAAPIAAAPDYARLDAAVSFDILAQWDEPPAAPFAARPSTMEWIGTVQFPEGRGQGLRLEATTSTQVFLNGTLVATTESRPNGRPITIELPDVSGRVPILVRCVRPADDDSGFWKLRVLWRTPGGGWDAFADYRPMAP